MATEVPAQARATIVLPAWRDAATLGEALADVRAQTGVSWACVLVLDGADAATREVALRSVDGDPRIRVLDRPHEGLVAALNAGVAAAGTDLIVRFDADDRMVADRVAALVDRFTSDPTLAVVTSHVAYASLSSETDGRGMARHVAWLNTLASHEDMFAMRYVDAPLAHPAVAFRRSAVIAATGGQGPYRDGDFAEDHDLWLRLFAAGLRFGVVPRPLVTWRDRPDRLTRADLRYRDDRRKRLVHGHLVDALVAAGEVERPLLVWGAGAYGRRHVRGLREAAEARGVRLAFRAFLDIDPHKVGRVVQGDLPVLDAAALTPPDGALILVAVASGGARPLIEARLAGRGWQRERDYMILQ
jgi:glycosyltransferase involved in cell wall biosynthesis